MKNFIHIMGINRSGGSLLARLLEGNEKVVSYPMEVGFKFKENLFPCLVFFLAVKCQISNE